MKDVLLSTWQPDAKRSSCANGAEADSAFFSVFAFFLPMKPVFRLERLQLILRKARNRLLLAVFRHSDRGEQFTWKRIPGTLVLGQKPISGSLSRTTILLARCTPAICISLNHIMCSVPAPACTTFSSGLPVGTHHIASCAGRMESAIDCRTCPHCDFLVQVSQRLPAAIATVPEISSLRAPLLHSPTRSAFVGNYLLQCNTIAD
mmetsp:Transcript_91896/g.163603  ORF Transcript_91896/g.163603 Transcript_91896/m.163603 type:complete len:205 (-) Transcript_91896:635-1249(-)